MKWIDSPIGMTDAALGDPLWVALIRRVPSLFGRLLLGGFSGPWFGWFGSTAWVASWAEVDRERSGGRGGDRFEPLSHLFHILPHALLRVRVIQPIPVTH